MIKFNQKNNIRIITPKRDVTTFDVVSKVGTVTDGLTQEVYNIRVGSKLKYPDKPDKPKYAKEYIYRNIYRLSKESKLGKVIEKRKNYPMFLKITEGDESELVRIVSVLKEDEGGLLTFRVCIIQPLEFAQRVAEWQEVLDEPTES